MNTATIYVCSLFIGLIVHGYPFENLIILSNFNITSFNLNFVKTQKFRKKFYRAILNDITLNLYPV